LYTYSGEILRLPARLSPRPIVEPARGLQVAQVVARMKP
jgi:hypothetical protein